MRLLPIFCLLAVLSVRSALAQMAVPLNEYLRQVLDYSHTLKQADEGVQAAHETMRERHTGFLPRLSADGDFSVNFKSRYASDGEAERLLRPYSFSLQPALVQSVYLGGSVRDAFRQAEVGYDISQLQQQQALLEVAYLAEYNYWNLASNEALLRVSTRYEEIVRAMYDIVKTRFDDGYVAKTDLLMIQTRLREAEFGRIRVENLYRVSLQNFNILTGVEPDLPRFASDSIMQPVQLPDRVTPEEAFDRHPEYRMAHRQIDYRRYGVRLVESRFNPQLTAGVQGMWNPRTPNFSGRTEVDGLTFLRLSVPIFHWGERRHAVAAARADLRSAEYALSQTTDDLTLGISTAWTQILEASIQIDISEANLEVARENLSLNTFSYNEGLLTILDVISAQLSWLQAYTNAITANFNEKVAIAAYRKAAGILPR